MMKSSSSVVPLSHPMVGLRAARIAQEVEHRFRSWLPSPTREDLLRSLEPFAKTRPLCYFDQAAVSACLPLLDGDRRQTVQALRAHDGAVTHAILSLFRLGESAKLETSLGMQTPSQIAEMERVWHPEYQRYMEHIHNNLITVILEILGNANGKDYTSLTLANRIERLDALGLGVLAAGASATIRNAISHGGVRFGHARATYASSNDAEELSPPEFARRLDKLADVSAAIVASMLLFLCRNPQCAAGKSLASLPLGVRYLLVRGATTYKGFVLESVSESEIEGRPVLNLYCVSRSRSRMVHRYDGLAAASQALYYGGEGYHQIAVSIDCDGSVPTYSPYRVKEMKAAFAAGASKSLLAGVLDAKRELLWYDASAIARRMYALWCAVHEAWLNERLEVIRKWRDSGFDVVSSRYQLRFTNDQGNKSVEKLRRVEGHAVLLPGEKPDGAMLERIARHATRRLRRRLLVRYKGLTGRTGVLRRFPRYVWVKVHAEDGRMRDLEERGPGHSALLALSEWTHRKYRHKPVVLKGIQEIRRGWRVAVPQRDP